MKAPRIIQLDEEFVCVAGCQAKINGKWVPVRPEGYYSIANRIKCAWMVFTGKADALVWPEGQ